MSPAALPIELPNPDPQRVALGYFRQLLQRRSSWSHRFVAISPASPEFAAAAMGCLAAGAACLLIDSESENLRRAAHQGAVDFTVSGLPEALRILKNEIRKGTAVSVGLCMSPQQAVQQMVYRGVAPDAVLFADPLLAGAISLPGDGIWIQGNAEFDPRHDCAYDRRERLARDADLLLEPRLAEPNRRWLAAAPRLFPRDLHRVLLRAGSCDIP